MNCESEAAVARTKPDSFNKKKDPRCRGGDVSAEPAAIHDCDQDIRTAQVDILLTGWRQSVMRCCAFVLIFAVVAMWCLICIAYISVAVSNAVQGDSDWAFLLVMPGIFTLALLTQCALFAGQNILLLLKSILIPPALENNTRLLCCQLSPPADGATWMCFTMTCFTLLWNTFMLSILRPSFTEDDSPQATNNCLPRPFTCALLMAPLCIIGVVLILFWCCGGPLSTLLYYLLRCRPYRRIGDVVVPGDDEDGTKVNYDEDFELTDFEGVEQDDDMTAGTEDSASGYFV